jgi:hydrogenase expression/formation protein HypC
MCLAIPGKLISINKELEEIFQTGKVSFEGVKKEVNLSMVPEAKVGDYILVHVGTAISVVDEEEAKKTFEYIREIGELSDLKSDLD